MEGVVCPGCGETVRLQGLKIGDRIDCTNCADLTLRLVEKDGQCILVDIPKVSCPSCDRILEVPDGLGRGGVMTCCGVDYMLTYEFGAYALVPYDKDGIN